LARKAHPNLFEPIELIKNEKASTEVQMIQLAASDSLDPRKEKLLDTMSKSKLVAEFSNGQKHYIYHHFLPCLCFWHAIPTSLFILNDFFFL